MWLSPPSLYGEPHGSFHPEPLQSGQMLSSQPSTPEPPHLLQEVLSRPKNPGQTSPSMKPRKANIVGTMRNIPRITRKDKPLFMPKTRNDTASSSFLSKGTFYFNLVCRVIVPLTVKLF